MSTKPSFGQWLRQRRKALDLSRRSIFTSLIPVVRDSMGTERFTEAWVRGRTLSLEQALDYALSEG
jgi:hypothetical protein